MATNQSVLSVQNIVTRFGDQVIHDGISFDVNSGQVVTLIGGSGTGKTTLLREILGLLPPASGSVTIFGCDVWSASEKELDELRRCYGVLFQDGALFSAMTVGENIAVPLAEYTRLTQREISDIVGLRLGLVGLDLDVATKMPSELSGGMRKRVGLARALALEPQLLFLDEPTSGLDPISARAFDRLVRTLSDSLGLTVFIVTHDLDTIYSVADRIIALDNGKLLADGVIQDVSRVDNPWIKSYFDSRRV